MDEDLNSTSTQVIKYNDSGLTLSAPEAQDGRFVAYIRPGDKIQLNFDITDLKVDIIDGDLQIIFINGSTITIASLAALGFMDSQIAPKLIEVGTGSEYDLHQFLNATRVLSYDDALLILANRDEYSFSETPPDIVKTASDQDGSLELGAPISGVGETTQASKGSPSTFVDPQGIIDSVHQYEGVGNFVVTIYTTNLPFLLDKSNNFPGDTTIESQPSLVAKVLYGAALSNATNITMGSKDYTYYTLVSGLGDSEEVESQLYPVVVRDSSNNGVFVNTNADNMNYVIDLAYGGEIFPNKISVVLSAAAASVLDLTGIGFTFDRSYVDGDGQTVYEIENLSPSGTMQYNLSFAQNTPTMFFEFKYVVQYLNPSTGELDTMEVSQAFVIASLTSSSDLNIASNRDLLSSTSNPVDVVTGSGDDVIVTGGGENSYKTTGGNNSVFSGSGNNTVVFGSGDDKYWAGGGVDTVDGGGGTNTVYYNNFVGNIDPNQTYFKDSYYNTYREGTGLSAYFGLARASLLSLITNKQLSATSTNALTQATSDGSIYISKAGGADVIKNVQNYYLSQFKDIVYVSSVSYPTSVMLYGGGSARGINNKDEIRIHDTFVLDGDGNGATIDVLNGVVRDSAGNNLIRFYSVGDLVADGIVWDQSDENFSRTVNIFNSFVGGSGNDTFIVAYQTQFDGSDAYTFRYNGGSSGYNTLDFSSLGTGFYINFNAQASIVIKYNGSAQQTDIYSNMHRVIGSHGDDTIQGSYDNSYDYVSPGGNNTVTYYSASAGVTLELATGIVWKARASSMNDINTSTTAKDTFDGNYTITLSRYNNFIIGTDNGDYKIQYSGGSDTLSYRDLSGGIKVTFTDGGTTISGSVEKSGGTDTFEYQTLGGVRTIYGTAHDDTFYMSRGLLGTTLNLYGEGGSNTLDYSKITTTADGASTGTGVTFSFGATNYVTKERGSIDNFHNFSTFIGTTSLDDTVIFNNVESLAQIQGIQISFSGGFNTVILTNMPDTLPDVAGVDKISSQIIFDDSGVMKIFFGQFVSSKENLTRGGSAIDITGSGDLQFKNVQGIQGTSNNDILTMSDISYGILFNGRGGSENVADYRTVTSELVFDVGSSANENVSRGSTLKDTILNVEVYYGGTNSNTFNISATANTQGYIFYGNTAASLNKLSYENLTSGITVDLKANEVFRNNNTVTDKFYDMDHLVGSAGSDTFIAYEYTGEGPTSIDVNGGSGGQNRIDFSRFENSDNALDITLDGKSIVAGGITWNLTRVFGIIGTNFDDNIKVSDSGNGYQIDGGGSKNNVLDYSGITETSLTLTISGETSNLTKQASTDTIKNIQSIILGSKNDTVVISSLDTSVITSIDGGGYTIDLTSSRIGNTLDFSPYNGNLTVNIDSTGTFSLALANSNLSVTNFHTILATQKDTNFVIANGTTIKDGLVLIGNTLSGATTTVDFTAVTTGMTLNISTIGVATITGGVTGTIRFASIAKIDLGQGDDYVYASGTAFNTTYNGNAGTNTLDYSNLNLGVYIDFNEGRIYKVKNKLIYDEYTKFSKIVGTKYDDTVIVSNLDNDLSYTIDLSKGGTSNTVEINLASSVTYTMSTSALSSGNSTKTIGNIIGANILKLSTSNNDTVVFDNNYSNSSFKSTIDGGGGTNTIDASGFTQRGITFEARSTFNGGSRISGVAGNDGAYSSITWDSYVFANFQVVKGANGQKNFFYADFNTSYQYVGGTGTGATNTLSYYTSLAGVTIDLGAQAVYKRSDGNGGYTTQDSYQNINIIIGSNYTDTFLITQAFVDLGADVVNNMKVYGKDSSSTSTYSDVIVFQNITNFNSFSIGRTAEANTTQFVVGTTTYSPTFSDVTSYRFESGGNATVNVSGVFSELYSFIATGSNNTISYNTESFEFNALNNRANLLGGDTSVGDNIYGFATIVYAGTGNAIFYGASNNDYTYSATGTRAADTEAMLSYQRMNDTHIEVYFEAGSDGGATIYKGNKATATNQDKIGSGITYIRGTTRNDVFVLAQLKQGVTVKIDGYGGTSSSISFEQMYTSGQAFKANDLSAGNLGYIVVNDSIQTYRLTNYNDTFEIDTYADASRSFQLDGGGGINGLIYTAFGANSIQTLNITVDFYGSGVDETGAMQGFVQRRDATSNAIIGSDVIENFHYVKIANGNNNIILSDAQKTLTGDHEITAGSGVNSIDFSNMTAPTSGSTTFNYNTGIVSVIYSGTNSAINYNNFDTVTLIGGASQVNYTFAQTDLSKTISFVNDIASAYTSRFNLIASTGVFIFDTTSPVRTTVSLDSTSFLTFSSIYTVQVTGNATANFVANGSQSFEFIGGSGNNDSVSYASVAQDITLTITSMSAQTANVVVTGGSSSGDKLTSINSIVLGSGNDTVVLTDNYSGSDVVFTINGGIGENTISLQGFTSGQTIDLSNTTMTFPGFKLINFTKYTFTDKDDTVIVNEGSSYILDGGGGRDTLNFKNASSADFANGVSLIMTSPTNLEMTVVKNNSANVDYIKNFEIINLSSGNSTFEYASSTNKPSSALDINFKTGTTGNTATFTRYTGTEGLLVDIDGSSIKTRFSSTAATSYDIAFTNINRIVGTQSSNDTFTFTTLTASTLASIDGSGGVNTLAFASTITNNMDFNLNADAIKITGYDNTLSYSNITGFTGGGGTNIFRVGAVKSTGQAVAYTIDGGTSGKNTITYEEVSVNSGSIDVVISADSSNAITMAITKNQNNQVDNVKNVQTIIGTSGDDTFKINQLTSAGIVIVGGGSSLKGDLADFSSASTALDFTFTIDNSGTLLLKDTKTNVTLQDIVNVTFDGTKDNQLNISAGAASAGATLTLSGAVTFNFTNMGAATGGFVGNAIVDLINNVVSYEHSGGSVLFNLTPTDTSSGINGVYLGGANTTKGSVTVYVDENTKAFGNIQQDSSTTASSGSSSTILDLSNWKAGVSTYIDLIDPSDHNNTGRIVVAIATDSTYETVLGTVQQISQLILGKADDNVRFNYAGYNQAGTRSVDGGGSINNKDSITLFDDGTSTLNGTNKHLFLTNNMVQMKNQGYTFGGTGNVGTINSNNIMAFYHFNQLTINNAGANDRTKSSVNILDTYAGALDKITYGSGDGTLRFLGTDGLNTVYRVEDGSAYSSSVIQLLLGADNGSSSVTFGGNKIYIEGFTTYYLGVNNDTIVMSGDFYSSITTANPVQIRAASGTSDMVTIQNNSFTLNTNTVFVGDNQINLGNGALTIEDKVTVYGVNNITFTSRARVNVSDLDSLIYNTYQISVGKGESSAVWFADSTISSVEEITVSDGVILITGLSNGTSSKNFMLDTFDVIFNFNNANRSGFKVSIDQGTASTLTNSLQFYLPANVLANAPNEADFSKVTGATSGSWNVTLGGGGTSYQGAQQQRITLGANSGISVFCADIIYMPQGNSNFVYTNPGETIYTPRAVQVYGSSGTNNVTGIAAAGGVISGNTVTRRGVTDTFYAFNTITTFSAVVMRVGETDSVYNLYSLSNDAYDPTAADQNSILFVQLSSEVNTINILGMESGKVVDTGGGRDNISLSGDAFGFDINQVNESLVLIDGQVYNTGGSYLIVTDSNGNSMYFLNTTLDSILNGNGLREVDGIAVSGGSDKSEAVQDTSTEKVDYDRNTWWDENTVSAKETEETNVDQAEEAGVVEAEETVVDQTEEAGVAEAEETVVDQTEVASVDQADTNEAETLSLYTLLERTFGESDTIDNILEASFTESESTSEIATFDNAYYGVYEVGAIPEEVVESNTIENNFKLDDEGKEDPSKSLQDILSKMNS